MIVFSGTLLKLPIQAAYSQQNCGGGNANSNSFLVTTLSQVFAVDHHLKMIRNFPYLKHGMRDFKKKRGKIRD